MNDEEILRRIKEVGEALSASWEVAPHFDDPRDTFIPEAVYEREGEPWGAAHDRLVDELDHLVEKLNESLPPLEVSAVSFDPEASCGRSVRALACDVSAHLNRVFGDARLSVAAREGGVFELHAYLPGREDFSSAQITEYLDALASSRAAAYPDLKFKLIENGQTFGREAAALEETAALLLAQPLAHARTR